MVDKISPLSHCSTLLQRTCTNSPTSQIEFGYGAKWMGVVHLNYGPFDLDSRWCLDFLQIKKKLTETSGCPSWPCTQTSPGPAILQSAVLRRRGSTRCTELTCELTQIPRWPSRFFLPECLSEMTTLLDWWRRNELSTVSSLFYTDMVYHFQFYHLPFLRLKNKIYLS